MKNDTWSAVDNYLNEKLVPQDDALLSAVRASEKAGLPSIQLSPTQGKLLHLLAKSHSARNILEIGTLGGYSTIWLARALPAGGRLISLEASPKHAEVARGNIAHAGLGNMAEVRLGSALDTLPKLEAEKRGPFDFIFIDADKSGYPEYLQWSLKLSRAGTLIVADNVIRDGAVIDPASPDKDVQGVRKFIDLITREPRVTATAMQTVGSKGYDGFVIALVNS